MYIVNWYPASYGDRIIKDLFDIKYRVTEKNLYSLPITPLLKLPEFYNYDSHEWFDYFYSTITKNLTTFGVVGAHRLNRFDFKKFLPNVQVISIDPRKNIESVVDSFFKKVQGVRPKLDNQFVQYLLNKNQINSAKIYQQKLILDWTKDNILDTDIIFDLDQYFNDADYMNWFKINALSQY